jgi:hypothetical protein
MYVFMYAMYLCVCMHVHVSYYKGWETIQTRPVEVQMCLYVSVYVCIYVCRVERE